MENFLKYLINGLTLGGMYGLIALGYTMVYGIIKLINFAHGDILMVGAFLGYFFLSTLAFNGLTPLLLYGPLTIGLFWWGLSTGVFTGHKHTLMTVGVLLLAMVLALLIPAAGSATKIIHSQENAPALRVTMSQRDLGWRGLQISTSWGDEETSRDLIIKRGGLVVGTLENWGATTPASLSLSDGTALQLEQLSAGTLPRHGEIFLYATGRALGFYIPWAALLILPIAMASGLKRMRLIGATLGGGVILGALTTNHLVFATMAAMVYSGGLGVLIEKIAYKPLRTAPRIAALITAIGVSLLLENAGIMIWGERDKSFSDLNPTVGYLISGQIAPLRLGIVTIGQKELLIFIVTVLLMVGLQYLVMKTRVGKAMRAVSMDRDAARLMGINVDATISATFAIGSALAAAAGVLWGIYYNTLNPDMGIWPGIKAFVAAVLGGIGSIPGAMVGGLVMGVAENLVVGYLASSYRDAIAFALLILILLVRPTGLFGSRAGEKV